MTPQDIFDTVASGLLLQGIKSVSPKVVTAYYGVNGTRCAIGFLIPQEFYDECTELHNTPQGLIDSCPELKESWGKHLVLIYELQRIHDVLDPKEWRSELRRVAWKFGLADTVLLAPRA